MQEWERPSERRQDGGRTKYHWLPDTETGSAMPLRPKSENSAGVRILAFQSEEERQQEKLLLQMQNKGERYMGNPF